MKLVENWKEAYRWFSTWAFSALIAFPPVWATLPADLKAAIPSSALLIIVGLVAAGGLAGRLVDQKP